MFELKIIVVVIMVLYQYFTVPVVLQDPKIEPPIAQPNNNKEKPRLVINVTENGKFSHNGKNITEDDITTLCKEHKTKHPDGIVHLRCDKKTSFQHVRTVIRASAKGGLDNVVFSVHGPEKPKVNEAKRQPKAAKEKKELSFLQKILVGTTIQLREQELNIALPAAAPLNNQAPAIQPLFISISTNGTVHINQGKAKEALDTDTTKRDLPILKTRLDAYVAGARAGGQEPSVQVHAAGNVKQQRVIDVLNALATSGVSKVTFAELVDAE